MHQTWPLGEIPEHLQRPELKQIEEQGYEFNDPYEVVEIFEDKVAKFTGADYGIAVDCASHGLFLTLKYLEANGTITIPKHTYVSVPMQIHHAGCAVEFTDEKWVGSYKLDPYLIHDMAALWKQGMFKGDFSIVSFQIKKAIPIGRGGMILTNDKDAAEWLRKARHDGRSIFTYYAKDEFAMNGWHYYMTPEDAARGILLMDEIGYEDYAEPTWQNYIDISKKKVFNE